MKKKKKVFLFFILIALVCCLFNRQVFIMISSPLRKEIDYKIKKLDIPEIDPENITSSMKKLQEIANKKSWILRAKKFTDRYFAGDKKKMTYCLKDVDALKKWHDLKRTYVQVPWGQLVEKTDNTKPEQYQACGGGKCMIWKM